MFFFDFWSIDLNKVSSSQPFGTIGWSSGCAAKSRNFGHIMEIWSHNRKFFCFYLDPAFLLQNILCFNFFNVNYWKNFQFTARLVTDPIYLTMWSNLVIVCFQRTGYFLRLRRKVSCVLPATVIRFAVCLLIITDQKSKCFFKMCKRTYRNHLIVI